MPGLGRAEVPFHFPKGDRRHVVSRRLDLHVHTQKFPPGQDELREPLARASRRRRKERAARALFDEATSGSEVRKGDRAKAPDECDL